MSIFDDIVAEAQGAEREKPNLQDVVSKAARRFGVPEHLAHSLIGFESGYKPGASSPAGARGIGQVMPSTARGMIDPDTGQPYNPDDMWDPRKGAEASMQYFSQQLKEFGDPKLAAAAYFAGPRAVRSGTWKTKKDVLGMTGEAYAARVAGGARGEQMAGKVAAGANPFDAIIRGAQKEEGPNPFDAIIQEAQKGEEKFQEPGPVMTIEDLEKRGQEQKLQGVINRLVADPLAVLALSTMERPRNIEDFKSTPPIPTTGGLGEWKARTGPEVMTPAEKIVPIEELPSKDIPVTAGEEAWKAVQAPSEPVFQEIIKEAQKEKLESVEGKGASETTAVPFHLDPVTTIANAVGAIPSMGLGGALRLGASLGSSTAAGEATEQLTGSELAGMAANLGTFMASEKLLRGLGKFPEILLAAKAKKPPIVPGEAEKVIDAIGPGIPAAATATKDLIPKAPKIRPPWMSKRANIVLAQEGADQAVIQGPEGVARWTGRNLPERAQAIQEAARAAGAAKEVPKDIRPQIGGKHGSLENYTYAFDRMEEVSPGIKNDIFWRRVALENSAKKEWKALEGESRRVEKELEGLSKGASERMHIVAIAEQKNGLRELERQGITQEMLPQLSPHERGALEAMKVRWKEFGDRVNRAREMAGLKPFKIQDNYATFMRDYLAVTDAGFNPISRAVPQDIGNFARRVQTAGAFPWEKSRRTSEIPFKFDIFDAFRAYSKRAIEWSTYTPHITEVRRFADDIRNVAPNMAGTLDQWLVNISGNKNNNWGLFGNLMNATSRNLGVSMLSGSVRTMLNQINSVLYSSSYSLTGALRSVAEVYGGAVANLATAPGRWLLKKGGVEVPNFESKALKWVRQNSNVLPTREPDIDIANALETAARWSGAYGQAKKGATEIAFIGLREFDRLAAESAGLQAYRIGKKMGLEGTQLINFVDDKVLKTQASASLSNLANIQTNPWGRWLTLYQTFLINEANFIKREIIGFRNPEVTKGMAMLRAARTIAAGMMINSLLEDGLGIPTSNPRPIRAMEEEAQKGSGTGRVALEGLMELPGSLLPVVSGGTRMGGSPIGPVPTFLSELAKTVRGDERSSVDAWSIPFRLMGWPMTHQISKLIQPDRYTLKEALLGKMREPKSTPQELSRVPGLGRRKAEPDLPFKPGVLEDIEDFFKRKR